MMIVNRKLLQVEDAWKHIKNSMTSTATSISSGAIMHPNDHRIISRLMAYINGRKIIPASNDFDITRRYLRRQIAKMSGSVGGQRKHT